MDLREAQALWHPAGPYVDTATYGLPPDPAWEALQQALGDWQRGRSGWEPWNEETNRARAIWARLAGVPVERVAVGATTSELVGLVAAALPAGSRVVSYEREFTSLLWPWMATGCEVDFSPLQRLPHERADVIAVSAVQSATGELVDLDALAAADTLTVVDATQAVGWLPLAGSRFDAVVCSGYKWLCSPRGTAYIALSERLLERLRPLHAGWFAGEQPYESYYGPPLRLASGARRLDTSPAWFSWVGAAAALAVLEEVGVEAIHQHDVALANRFRAGLGLEPASSAIVRVDVEDAAARLERAGIRAATRASGLRASFHVYNTEADADAALDALVS